MLNAWHYHPECELLHIKHSYGTCLIGDYVGPFKKGDLFLFGSHLPHTFLHEKKYMERSDDKFSESVVVLFQDNFCGDSFLELPEIKSIAKLLELSKYGLRINGETRKKVTKIAEEMLTDTPTRKLINLLSALELIAGSEEYDFVSTTGFNQDVNSTDKFRINKIFDFTFNNFHRKIELDDVASQIGMVKHSFCRYFKSKTKKTYIQFLMEVRIENACRLLVEEDLSVAEIGNACGYNNISNFYHQFKNQMQKNPLDYKADFLKTQRYRLVPFNR